MNFPNYSVVSRAGGNCESSTDCASSPFFIRLMFRRSLSRFYLKERDVVVGKDKLELIVVNDKFEGDKAAE